MVSLFTAILYCWLMYLEMCLEIYEADPAKFVLTPGLA